MNININIRYMYVLKLAVKIFIYYFLIYTKFNLWAIFIDLLTYFI